MAAVLCKGCIILVPFCDGAPPEGGTTNRDGS